MNQSFCCNCGTPMDANTKFCPNCGAPANGQVGVQPTQYVQFVKPKIPGRGLGISAMVLGIIGIVYSAIFTLLALSGEYIEGGAVIFFSIFGILSVVFGGSAKSKGYDNGVSTSGLVMGILIIVCCFITLLTGV